MSRTDLTKHSDLREWPLPATFPAADTRPVGLMNHALEEFNKHPGPDAAFLTPFNRA